MRLTERKSIERLRDYWKHSEITYIYRPEPIL